MDQLFAALPGLLLPWYAQNRRDLPWRRDKEPYHVWLSEVMLQQTRVEAVKGYYARFLDALPTVKDLANASDELCHKLWEGLGYYTRVRNLQKAARVICTEHGGVFPRDYAAVRALPGIGDYTAGAVCSICFGMPTPAVDGNVLRVISRLTADGRDMAVPAVKKEITASLARVYPAGSCGDFTQALMELGATVCVPNGMPRCDACPLRSLCAASGQGNPTDYPVRTQKKPRRQEQLTLLVLRCGDAVALEKRPEKGLLAGLWQYPNVAGKLTAEEAIRLAEDWGTKPLSPERIVEKEHIFTHVHWQMRGIYLTCSAMPERFTWATEEQLDETYALPTAFRQFKEHMGVSSGVFAEKNRTPR